MITGIILATPAPIVEVQDEVRVLADKLPIEIIIINNTINKLVVDYPINITYCQCCLPFNDMSMNYGNTAYLKNRKLNLSCPIRGSPNIK